jgi:sugar phosphate isomerase/epimerase
MVMARQFSLAHLTAIQCPPPELIRIARDVGYDYVSLRVIPLGEPVYDLGGDPAQLKAAKAALAETGMPVLDVELARILPDLDVRTYEPAFAAAAELGAKHVISSIWVADKAFAAAKLAEMCDLAKPYGLTINLEYLPFVQIDRFSDVVEIQRAAGRPNSGLLIDTLYCGAYDLAELDPLPRNLFNFIHLADGPNPLPTLRTPEMFSVVREGRLYAGDGQAPIADVLRRLPGVPISIELPNAVMAKELGHEGHARRCLEKAKRYVAERVDRPSVQAVA